MLPPELDELDELLDELDPLDDDDELLELLLDPPPPESTVDPASPPVAVVGVELQAAKTQPATTGASANVVRTYEERRFIRIPLFESSQCTVSNCSRAQAQSRLSRSVS